MKNKSIILLSSGLDCTVSLAMAKDEYNIVFAITFDYGQKSFKNEFTHAKKICDYYNLSHEVVKLDWLKKISNSSLTQKRNVPKLNESSLVDKLITEKSAKDVWVPNRNALFINIAACYSEIYGCTHIIIGANKEEGETFKDNSKAFIDTINSSLKNSANSQVQVYAPLINYNKSEIVKKGIEYNIPFKYIYSCYNNSKKHCGKCESCLRLKRALQLNNREDIIKELF